MMPRPLRLAVKLVTRLGERAFADGLDVLRRYVKLAESRGVEEVLDVVVEVQQQSAQQQ